MPEPPRSRLPRGCSQAGDTRAIVRCVIGREGQSGNRAIWECIIARESGWNPWATGAAGERGLTQIHPIHIAWIGWDRWAQMYSPLVNIETAIALYRRAGGFGPWTTRGWCV